MDNELMFSHKTDDWSTHKEFYAELDKEFSFDYDPCPLRSELNALSITVRWGKRVFVNPPYSNIKEFMNKAINEIMIEHSEFVVFLVPSRTDIKWFHNICLPFSNDIRFIKGRLKFGEHNNSAPFPSIVVVFGKLKGKTHENRN